MNFVRVLLFRGLLLVTLISTCVYLTYGKESSSVPHIVRNVAWNDFIAQIKFLPYDSPQDSLDKEMFVIQKFLKAHETEVRVGIYDIEVFKAIDQARARLQKADRDLEVTRGIQDSGRLQQMSAAYLPGRRSRLRVLQDSR
jgi:hypothetical protein